MSARFSAVLLLVGTTYGFQLAPKVDARLHARVLSTAEQECTTEYILQTLHLHDCEPPPMSARARFPLSSSAADVRNLAFVAATRVLAVWQRVIALVVNSYAAITTALSYPEGTAVPPAASAIALRDMSALFW